MAALLAAPLLASASAAPDGRQGFLPLRQDEDWRPLCAPGARQTILDQLKCVPLAGDGAAWLSLGGEVRERFEYTDDPLWGEDPQDDGVFLQRYILGADLHLGPQLRLFGQLYSALEDGRAGPTSPVDENRLDLQQGFVELRNAPDATTTALLRLGRQELRYGTGRLVDVREGPNVRRKFDGGLGRLQGDGWRLDALAARPAEDEPGIFDDGTRDDQGLWGAYATTDAPGWLPFGGVVDLYYLGYRNEDASYVQGSGGETRQTLGMRLAGEQAGWDWNWELIGQFGRFAGGDIRAWSVASDTGYTWNDLPWQPRFGLSANIASGDDDPDDAELGTFNPLYPRGNYFSELALLGPRNFYNLHPFLTVRPTERLELTADLDLFWRLEAGDGIYAPNGQLLRAPDGSDAHHVGTEISVNATWQVHDQVSLTAIYAHFFPGRFIQETGPSDDIDYVELTVRFQF